MGRSLHLAESQLSHNKVLAQRTVVKIRGDDTCCMFHAEIGLESDMITGC